MYVLDSSGSINQNQVNDMTNWYTILNYLRQYTDSVTVGPDNYQFSLINYGDKAKLNFTFNQYLTNALVDKAIAEVPWKNQQTNTSGALWRTLEGYLSANGARGDAPNIVLLISDGQSNVDQHLLSTYAAQVKAIAEVFVIGVTDLINVDELKIIATEPNEPYLTTVDNFSDLNEALNPLAYAQCSTYSEYKP